jgi:hypothetical protein
MREHDELAELRRTVRELKDHEEIRQCLYRYSRGADRANVKMMQSAYYPDAIDEHGAFTGEGHKLCEWAIKHHTNAQIRTQHQISNVLIELDGDSAYVESYFTYCGMNREGPDLSIIGGRYVDHFERRDGKWAIARRLTIYDWWGTPAIPDGYGDQLNAMNAGIVNSRDHTDSSYGRPLHIKPERITNKGMW